MTDAAPSPDPTAPLLLLDFDGTLLETESIGIANFIAALARLTGRPEADFAAFMNRQQGRTLAQYHRALVEEMGVDPLIFSIDRIRNEHLKTLLPRFRTEGVEAPAHLIASLRRLHSAGCRLRIASNSERPRIDAALEGADRLTPGLSTDLLALVEQVHSAARFKPDPEVFLSALSAAGLAGHKPKQVVIVEDSLPGLTAANAFRERVFPQVRTWIVALTGLGPEPAEAAALFQPLADRVVQERNWQPVADAILELLAREG